MWNKKNDILTSIEQPGGSDSMEQQARKNGSNTEVNNVRGLEWPAVQVSREFDEMIARLKENGKPKPYRHRVQGCARTIRK
ncbi:hypothetical protein KW798_00030 [Candidatus Parcubacteria bacterium]|nr:hypothetical protein [Candidatus Parcubacteria bacterium]